MCTLRSVFALGLAILAPATPAGARSIAEVVRTGSADVPGGKLHYEATGGGTALVLIGGGSFMDLREWDDHFLPLGRTFGVVRYDPRGFGKSTPPDGPFAPHEDLRALLDHVHIERAHLVGGGAAGAIAIDFVLAYPDRVRSLVLVAPDVGGYEFAEAYRKREAALFAVLKKEGVADFAKAALDDDYLIPAPGGLMTRRRARQMLEDTAKRLLTTDARWLLRVDPPAISRLEEIHAPTLVVVGEEDHAEVVKLAGIVAGRIPGAKKVVLQKTGHTPYMERSRQFNRLLLDFLAALPPR